jgi:hypothetical protein
MRIEFGYMLVVLLLPLFPAFLLFRYLPSSEATVEGPLKGLKIKLGGALAGYVALVLLSWQVVASFLEPNWSDNWNVVAQIAFDGPPGSHPPPTQALVLVKPPTADIDQSGSFQMMIPIPRVHSGAIDIQRLVVSVEGYEAANVPLDPDNKHLGTYGGQDYQVTFDQNSHRILIGKPIVLTKAQ